jgi:hypothetical protein
MGGAASLVAAAAVVSIAFGTSQAGGNSNYKDRF